MAFAQAKQSLYSFIILTGLSVSILRKESLHFAGSCLVSIVFSSRTVYTERTLPHPQSGSGAKLKKILSRTMFHLRSILQSSTILMCDYEEDFTDIQKISRRIPAESMVDAYRAESTDQSSGSSGITAKISPLFDGSISWFKYEELIDDWLDLTVLEARKRGQALKNRLVGDADMHKGLLDRESLTAED